MEENIYYTSDFLLNIFAIAPNYAIEKKLRIIREIQSKMSEVTIEEKSNLKKVMYNKEIRKEDAHRSEFLVHTPDKKHVLCIICAFFDNSCKPGRKNALLGEGIRIADIEFKHANQRIKIHIQSRAHTNAWGLYNETRAGKCVDDNDKLVTVLNNRHIAGVVIRTIIFLISAGTLLHIIYSK